MNWWICPGTYTLLATNPAERVVLDYMVEKPVDAIINVVDATHLVQGLTLTLELMELGRPMVLVINMMDEAKRQGLKVDGKALSELLGIPVMPDGCHARPGGFAKHSLKPGTLLTKIKFPLRLSIEMKLSRPFSR